MTDPYDPKREKRELRMMLTFSAAIVLLILCIITFFAIFLGFGSQLTAMVVFYMVVSLWFHFYRYQYVRRGDQFTMPWPKPQGY